ncbi:BBSome-interacting protein 1 [Diplonema papillatum]|nr:BBSome-interacting protein 1 [Diplonema papillatum]
MPPKKVTEKIDEVLPKAGLVYSEKSTLSEILSKPKIMPIKSLSLEKLEEMEREMRKTFMVKPQTATERPTTAH